MADLIFPLKEQFKKALAKFQGHYDIIVLGAGPAGLSFATSAHDCGEKSILIIEKEKHLGGVLNHCLSDGFGEDTFAENLTGKEYVSRLVDMVEKRRIDYKLNTTVLSVTEDKCVYTVSPKGGLVFYKAKAIVYALGAHEVPRGSLCIPGSRPNGVYPAGTIQKMGSERKKLGLKNVVIFGSNDVGLSASHALSHDGINVQMIVEPHSYFRGGDTNKKKSLDEHNIPLKLSHTIVQILGKPQIESVVIAACRENGDVIEGTEQEVPCDALLISMGLSPENTILEEANVQISPYTKGPITNDKGETSVKGIFAIGNALFIHDKVDRIVRESIRVAIDVVKSIRASENSNVEITTKACSIPVTFDENILYLQPERIDSENADDNIPVSIRPKCERENCKILVKFDDTVYSAVYKHVLHTNAISTVYIAKADLINANAKSIQVLIEK